MALVFQYGSNCSEPRLNHQDRLRGDAQDFGLAETVDNYELCFDVWSNGNQCACADLVRGGDEPAQGVLYEIPDYLMSRTTAAPHGRKSFDAIEGTAYSRKPIKVRKSDGSIVDAETYLVITPQNHLRTSLDYVRYIIQGLRDHGADGGYLQKVKDVAARNNPTIAQQIQGL
ncbi:MAG TPA: gamma-glutamylcyclotransferase family protein [Candidatus Angelobacter sp.]